LAPNRWRVSAGWFSNDENLRTLECYCCAVALARRLHKAIEAADLSGDYKQFSRIHRALIQQTNLMISLTTKLRIWPHQGRKRRLRDE
jgi:hypothetical protein